MLNFFNCLKNLIFPKVPMQSKMLELQKFILIYYFRKFFRYELNIER